MNVLTQCVVIYLLSGAIFVAMLRYKGEKLKPMWYPVLIINWLPISILVIIWFAFGPFDLGDHR